FNHNMKIITQWISKAPLELIDWLASLGAIILLDPYGGSHLSLCPLSQVGLEGCPGCGLGRAMSLLARGEFQASWQMHPLASLALVVMICRRWQRIKNVKTTHK